MTKDQEWVPLSEVAEDARPMVQAFRDAGGLPYGSFAPGPSRTNFVRACEVNGLSGIDGVEHRDIVVPVSGGAIRVRLYRPAGGANTPELPLVFFIHGGGWVIGNIETHDGICRLLTRQTACTVASVEYRCSPEHQFPVPLRDCEQALEFLSENAAALSIDASRIIVAGDSAGGNMATIIANDASAAAGQYAVIGQILLYPVTDLTVNGASYQRFQGGFPLVTNSMLWFRDQYVPVGTPLDHPHLSPLLYAEGRRQPPMFMVTVGLDPLCDEGIDYANSAARAGGLVEHHHLPGHMHGIFTAAGRVATARTLLERVAVFIQHLS